MAGIDHSQAGDNQTGRRGGRMFDKIRTRPLCAASSIALALAIATQAQAQSDTTQPPASGLPPATVQPPASPVPGSAVPTPAGDPAPEPAGTQAPASGDDVGDIIVTAQKRSQSINNVGMAITAASGDQMLKLGITQTSDLVRIEPSFKFTQSSYGTPVLTLRGVGFNDVSLAASPTVSVYVDEVPLPFSIFSRGASLDLERVEVLKGPQGTLFGQNATGGAINYIAEKPTKDFTAGGEASYARFGYVNVMAFVGGPVSDTLTARVSLDVTQGGAWQRNYSRTDSLLGDQDLVKFRALLDWDAAPGFDLRLGMNAWLDKSETQVPQLQAIVLNRPSAAANVPYITGYPLAPEDPRAGDWDPRYRPRNDERFVQPFMRAQIALTDEIDLISTTSYIFFDALDLRSNDGVKFENNKGLNRSHSRNFYQEVRVAGQLFHGRSNFVIGGQVSKDDSSENLRRYYLESSPSYATTPRLTGGRVLAYDDSISKAVFGNLDFKITDQLSVNGGIRYTKFDLDHRGCSQDPSGNLARFIGSLIGQAIGPNECMTVLPDRTAGRLFQTVIDEDNISWRAQVDYKPADHTLLYASISRGYKAGTVPALSANTYTAQLGVTQESVLSYEAGFKASLVDRKVQLNGAAFYYDYTDKQLFGRRLDELNLFGSLILLVNVPKSRVYGAELSAVVVPFEGLTINGAVSYLNSRVTESFPNFNNYGRPLDFKGLKFPYTPEWSGSMGIEYRWPGYDGRDIFIGADVTAQTKSVSSFGGENPQALGVPGYISGDPSFNIPAYGFVNARAGIDLSDQWTLQVWGKNLFNKFYYTDLVLQNDTLGRRTGAPQTYGLTARFRY
jgi:outer membrane receptor protein involved in Fe transport